MSTAPKGYKILENIPVTGWHSSGKGVVSDGRHNIYVSHVIPGEWVNVAIAKRQKRNYIAGNVINVIQPSRFRINPVCSHFELCGGCNWMHMQYEQQLVHKKSLIEQALAKYQIPHPPIDDVVPSPRSLSYRGKVDFALNFLDNHEVYIGFHPLENPHTIFPLKECYITDPQVIQTAIRLQEIMLEWFKSASPSNNLKEILSGFTLRCNKNGDQMLIFHTLQESPDILAIVKQLISSNKNIKSIFLKLKQPDQNTFIHVWGETYLEENINQWLFKLSADAFFQPNIYLAEQLFQEIVTLASPSTNDTVYDLYTGVGTIAIHLAPYAHKVVGIENSKFAIQDARYNQQRNSLNNLVFEVGDVLKTFVPDFVKLHGHPDIVVLDPPRAGTLIETLKNMAIFRPKRIIYVSCNPVSLAWNLTYLRDFYTIEKIIPYDMFPQTHHVETLVRLERKRQ